jgi:hypothetical protein
MQYLRARHLNDTYPSFIGNYLALRFELDAGDLGPVIPADVERDWKRRVQPFLGTLGQHDSNLIEHTNRLAKAAHLPRKWYGDHRFSSWGHVRVEPSYRATAVAQDGVVTVSVGLLAGLEDMWQCVVSDNNTDLHTISGVEYRSDSAVSRDVNNFHVHDKTRFLDYSGAVELHELAAKLAPHAQDLEPSFLKGILVTHGIHFRKMMSFNLKRVWLADLLADLSATWVICHEAAHLCGGHDQYFKGAIGVSADELDRDAAFRQLARSLHTRANSAAISRLRKQAELQADATACQRLVELLLRDDVFAVYPFLATGVARMSAAHEEYAAAPRRAKTLLAIRLAVSCAIGAVFLFYRNVEKQDIKAPHYPSLGTRVSNILFSTIVHAARLLRVPNEDRTGFEMPTARELSVLGTGVACDANVLTWNLYRDKDLLRDPDLPEHKLLTISAYPADSPGFAGAGNALVRWAVIFSGAVADEHSELILQAFAESPHLQDLAGLYADAPKAFQESFLPIQLKTWPGLASGIQTEMKNFTGHCLFWRPLLDAMSSS